jgi:excisionase family DNA binding protein
MSFLRPQLLPVNNLSKIVEGFNHPVAVEYSLADLDKTVQPPQVPRRDPHRQSGRQRQHSTRPRRTKSGDDDADGEGDADSVNNTITDLNNLPALLTVDETASLLRTTRAAIYAMAERGRIAGITRVGRRLLVSRDALLRSLFEGRAPSPRGTRR